MRPQLGFSVFGCSACRVIFIIPENLNDEDVAEIEPPRCFEVPHNDSVKIVGVVKFDPGRWKVLNSDQRLHQLRYAGQQFIKRMRSDLDLSGESLIFCEARVKR